MYIYIEFAKQWIRSEFAKQIVDSKWILEIHSVYLYWSSEADSKFIVNLRKRWCIYSELAKKIVHSCWIGEKESAIYSKFANQIVDFKWKYFVNSLWIHHLLRENTMISLSVLRIHYESTICFANSLLIHFRFHYLFIENSQ